MAPKPIWEGDGKPVEMWLVQMDLANHSKWTVELRSMPEAHKYRKEFAESVTAQLHSHGFNRLGWMGDGGIFAADGQQSVSCVLRAIETTHHAFATWAMKVERSSILGLRVSAHRTRVTTAEDPAYCFGSGLNDFMKRERELHPTEAKSSTAITEAVFQDLEFEEQRRWVEFGHGVGTLGKVFGQYPYIAVLESNATIEAQLLVSSSASVIPPSQEDFSWLSGAWENLESGSWAYADTSDPESLRWVYCYGGDDDHTGTYQMNLAGDEIRGVFSWVKVPISGYVLLKPNERRDRLEGGWWYAEDVPAGKRVSFGYPGMVNSVWVHHPEKPYPTWAREALSCSHD